MITRRQILARALALPVIAGALCRKSVSPFDPTTLVVYIGQDTSIPDRYVCRREDGTSEWLTVDEAVKLIQPDRDYECVNGAWRMTA